MVQPVALQQFNPPWLTHIPQDDAHCLSQKWFRLCRPLCKKAPPFTSTTEPRVFLNQLSLPLGDYRGFIDQHGECWSTQVITQIIKHHLWDLTVWLYMFRLLLMGDVFCESLHKRKRVCDVLCCCLFHFSKIWFDWDSSHSGTWLILLKADGRLAEIWSPSTCVQLELFITLWSRQQPDLAIQFCQTNCVFVYWCLNSPLFSSIINL